MDEPLSTDPYKGVRDFYPAEWARMQALFARVRSTLRAWGYEEYNASPLERAELYEAKTSEEIVTEQTYTFTDRGERRVTLRPEMTPTLARMVAAKRRELSYPLRWYSVGNRFRYERPQRGRLREFYQVDVDLVGLAEGEADLEIVALAAEVMRSFDATEQDFVIRVNSRTLLGAACAAAHLSADATRAYLRLLDKKSKMTPEAFRAAQTVLTDKDPLELIDAGTMEAFVATLKERGVGNVVFDPTITRGFDYYTGIVFEVYDTNPANPRAMFGGGRYDGLMALFGSEPLPAVGFALGDVTLSDFLETHGLALATDGAVPELYLGTPSPQDVPAAQAFAGALRRQGVRVFVNLTDRALGDQIKDAVKRSIPYFAAYGKDEISSGSLRLKTLASGEETMIVAGELGAHIRSDT